MEDPDKAISPIQNVDSVRKFEFIAAAAVQYAGGRYEGIDHAQAWAKVYEKHKPPLARDDYQVGFVTNSKKFVLRDEARKIAERAGQLTEKAAKENGPILTSQELVPEYWNMDERSPEARRRSN